jgi:ribose 5-phosphate isomerase RpiB
VPRRGDACEHAECLDGHLGARVTGPGVAEAIVAIWLETEFEGGRHQSRVSKFSD